MIVKNQSIYHFNKRLIFVVFVVMSVFQILLIFNWNVWVDEATTISFIRNNDWKGLINTIRKIDVHPPLYYLMLKLSCSIIGYRFKICKLLSAIAIIVMHGWIGIIVLKSNVTRHSLYTGVLFGSFLIGTTISPAFLYMSTEVRMYSWAMCFVTLNGCYAYLYYKNEKRKDAILFLLFGVAAALTHYYALIAEIYIYCFLFILMVARDRRSFL